MTVVVFYTCPNPLKWVYQISPQFICGRVMLLNRSVANGINSGRKASKSKVLSPQNSMGSLLSVKNRLHNPVYCSS